MIFQLSSKVPLWMPAKDYLCPWKWLLSPCFLSPPRPPWRLHAWPLRVLPDLCPTLGSAAGMGGTWCHDISGRNSHLWVWSLLKRIPQLCDTQSMMPSVWLHWTSICLVRAAKRYHFLQMSFLIGVYCKMLETENTRRKRYIKLKRYSGGQVLELPWHLITISITSKHLYSACCMQNTVLSTLCIWIYFLLDNKTVR